MTELEQEAELQAEIVTQECIEKGLHCDEGSISLGFIAGANSKYVEKQKLKFAIEQLYRFKESTFGKGVNVIKELEQKLSEL